MDTAYKNELMRQREKAHHFWYYKYKEDLDQLYNICLEYYYIPFDKFLQLMYITTADVYDYKSKCWIKY